MNTTATKPVRKTATKTTSKPKTVKAGTGKGAAAGQKQTDAGLGKQGDGTLGKTPAPVVAAAAPLAASDTPKAKGAAPKPAAAKPAANPSVVRGGTAQVRMEMVPVPKKPYTARARKPELYPFGDLPPATKAKDGKIVGLSFFIPDSEGAEQKLMTARKRHKGVLFWSRTVREQVDGKGPEVPGLRIWRGTKGLDPK